jgi:hypothetical protein
VTRIRLSTALLAGALLASPALAHHSRANFDLDREIAIDGVVTEYAWKNPHAFVVVRTTTEDGSTQDWTFEMNSTPVLLRMGTTADSLKAGDHVIAHGNPDRNPDRRFAYTTKFDKDDGTEVWSWGKPDYASGNQLAAGEDDAGSTDFTGVWRIQFQPSYDVLGRNRPDTELVNTLPVTAKGQAELDAFDPDDNPEWDCLPISTPQILGYPYPFEIRHEDADTLYVLYEADHVERRIHMNESAPPADAERTPVGYSVGHIDDDGALVVDTARFAHVRWGAGEGVDTGEQKTTREVYRLVDDGHAMELTFTMEDPEHLAEPVTSTYRYNLNPGYEIQDYYCDAATARRHLTAGE